MTKRLGLIVTDASPLITLGAAQALSCLIMPNVPVFVPDMVYAEVARDMTKLGAKEVVIGFVSTLDRSRLSRRKSTPNTRLCRGSIRASVPRGGASKLRLKS